MHVERVTNRTQYQVGHRVLSRARHVSTFTVMSQLTLAPRNRVGRWLPQLRT